MHTLRPTSFPTSEPDPETVQVTGPRAPLPNLTARDIHLQRESVGRSGQHAMHTNTNSPQPRMQSWSPHYPCRDSTRWGKGSRCKAISCRPSCRLGPRRNRRIGRTGSGSMQPCHRATADRPGCSGGSGHLHAMRHEWQVTSQWFVCTNLV